MSEQRVALEILKDLYDKGDYHFPFTLVEEILKLESREQYSNESDRRGRKVETRLVEYLRDVKL